jgi:hypothetical protein
VPKQKLNLFNFSARQVAQPCAGAAQLMGSKALDVGTLRSHFHHLPDRLGCDAVASDPAEPTPAPKDRASIDASRYGPLIDGPFRRSCDRKCADVFSFANQVSNYALLLADLEILRFASDQFCPSQTAPNEQRQNRPITFTS